MNFQLIKILKKNLLLISLLTTSLVILICLLAIAKGKFYALELTAVQAQANQRLAVYQNALQSSVQRFEYLPSVLVDDPRIQKTLQNTQSAESISELLSEVNNRSGADEIFILNKFGNTVGASNYLEATSFVNQNYAFRPYFQAAKNGSRSFYFAVGATTGKAGLFFAEPVLIDDEFIGVVVVKISLDSLEANWAQSGEKIWISDELDIIFLSYRSDWRYQGLRTLSPDEESYVAQTKQYGEQPVTILNTVKDSDGQLVVNFHDMGAHILFRQKVNNINWNINWLYEKRLIDIAVTRSISSIVIIYLVLVIATLWLRERRRNAQSQSALATLIAQRESNQRAIIDGTDAGLINLTHEGKTTFINRQARQLFKLSEHELPDIESLIASWPGVDAAKQPVEATGIRADQTTFPILASANPIGLSNSHQYLITIHDISELKDAQLKLLKSNDELEQRVATRTEELKNAEKELNQSQRLASLGRMSSAIAHEINQPITALSSYAASSELLLQRNQPEKVVGNLKKITALIERLSYISRQLRMVSGKRNSGLSVIKLLPAVQYAQDVLATKLSQYNVTLSINVNEHASATGNSMMLEQVLVNLLSNAIDAVSSVSAPEVDISVTSDSSTHLLVKDNGVGLSPEETLHIFEPFYSAKQADEGLGLGLAISYSLVSDMGGQLKVDSQLGEGTLFTVTLSQ